jgi:GT2 family glycosyltransferase
MIDVSVIICAYTEERWADIVAAVESLRGQIALPREIILVIDHNPSLYKRVRREISDVIAIENHEPRGLSGARNSGIAIAKSEWIAFLDDDATAATDWLARLYHHCTAPKPFFRGAGDMGEQVLGAGGAVEPRWEGVKPAWFPEEFYWVVGCTYRGLPDKVSPVRNPLGGCMCVRREIFEVVGGFRSGIGRVGKLPVGCEETELCIRARQHWPTRVFLFEPEAKIYHRVAASRMRWVYFRSRCYAEGLSKALVSKLVGSDAGLSAERAYTLYTLPLGVGRGLRDALRGDWAGLGRACAIVTGLLFTVAGYAVGLVTQNPTAFNTAERPAARTGV